MNSKSLVNKSIIKSDLRRYWYQGAMFAILLLLTTALPAHEITPDVINTSELTFQTSRFANLVQMSVFPIMLFSIIIPAFMFSYMHHKSAVNAAHSLPIERAGLYVSHLISAEILIVAAVAVNTVIMLTTCAVPASYVFMWALMSLIYCFVLSMFSAMASMLVGNIAAGIVLPYIIIALPAFIRIMFEFFCEQYLYGYTSSASMGILKYIYMNYSKMLEGWLGIYIALGILFFILGLVFYKKRQLENNSRILAFDFMNPVFMYSFSLCLGFLGYAYVYSVNSYISSMWIALPFGIAGVIIAKMIINKTFKPKGVVIPAIIYALMMCVVYIFFGLDVTGYEKRMPETNEIASIDIVGYSDENYTEYDNDRTKKLAPEAIYDPRIYDREDIEKVLALHKEIAEHGETDNDDLYITIEYKLANGKSLKRDYGFDESDTLYKLYGEVMDIESVKANRFPILSTGKKEYTDANVASLRAGTQYLTDSQLKQIIPALEKDIRQAEFSEYYTHDAVTMVDIGYRRPTIYEDGTAVTNKADWISTVEGYNVYPSYTNTIALLKEWGMYNKTPSANDVKVIRFADIVHRDNEMSYEYAEQEWSVIEDKAKIQKTLDNIVKNEDKMRQRYSNNSIQTIQIEYADGTTWSSAFTEKVTG